MKEAILQHENLADAMDEFLEGAAQAAKTIALDVNLNNEKQRAELRRLTDLQVALLKSAFESIRKEMIRLDQDIWNILDDDRGI